MARYWCSGCGRPHLFHVLLFFRLYGLAERAIDRMLEREAERGAPVHAAGRDRIPSGG